MFMCVFVSVCTLALSLTANDSFDLEVSSCVTDLFAAAEEHGAEISE